MKACIVLLGMFLSVSAYAGVEPHSLYDGASLRFEQAWFVKPMEATNLGNAYRLAPLLIQETHGSNALVLPKTIYYRPSAVRLNGIRHAQLTYWWRQPSATEDLSHPSPRPPHVHKTSSAICEGQQADSETDGLRGVRLTLDEKGFPVIYEILEKNGGITQVYVAQSVEAAARAASGPPLPGRRHAVEPSLDAAPDLVVPRVIDDAPDVMGPILYMRSDDSAVVTLICRCMEAQAHSLIGASTYELVKGIPPPEIREKSQPLESRLRLSPPGK
jgi:hypothetical protein